MQNTNLPIHSHPVLYPLPQKYFPVLNRCCLCPVQSFRQGYSSLITSLLLKTEAVLSGVCSFSSSKLIMRYQKIPAHLSLPAGLLCLIIAQELLPKSSTNSIADIRSKILLYDSFFPCSPSVFSEKLPYMRAD